MTGYRPPVVVGVDGSPSAMLATRWAAREASAAGAALRLVNAAALTRPSRRTGVLREGTRGQDLFVGQACARLDLARRQSQEVAPGVEVATELVTGDPVEALVEMSGSAEQIVLGSRGLGGLDGVLRGSVGIGLAARAVCPVVVVRGPETDEARSDLPVVVGVDLSAHSYPVLAYAYRYAARHRAPVTVLTAVAGSAAGTDRSVADARLAEERRRLTERVRGWQAKYPEVRTGSQLVRDRPEHALLERSHAARLVVVGTRGRGGVAGLMLGSTSQALIRRAHCPVAVIRV